MSLTVYASNRMEELVAQLAAVVARPLDSPLVPETIVVQSRGMERWVAMELAKRFGVWANSDYPFPNALVWRIFGAVVPDLPAAPDVSPYHPEVMAWRIMGMLSRLLDRPGFEPLRSYLAEDSGGLKRFQLAGKIADTFDQYSLYRPELLCSWERGEGGDWQAHLWRELVAGCTEPHRAALLETFRRRIGACQVDRARLPERISLIGIPTLPPFHLEVLSRVAAFVEVHLLLLNPCREYWGKIVSAQELSRFEKRVGGGFDLAASFEMGNPLLASLGKVGRDFFDLLAGYEGADVRERFLAPPADTLLHAIQGDILELRDRGADDGCLAVQADDDSLRIHSCHTELREVEILHDTLLSLFERDPTLAPRDILVMAPDIEGYAPYISAVFGSPEEGTPAIPFSIADRSLRREGEIAEALLAILRLAGGRVTAVQVCDVLERPPIARRFGLSATDLEQIRQWVREAGIRWGIDGDGRRAQGVPPFAEHSWRTGLDRLLLGYALSPGTGGRFFQGILPCAGVQGGNAPVLGRFVAFCERLFALLSRVARPLALSAWGEVLREVVDGFMAPDGEHERERLGVVETIGRLVSGAAAAGFAGEASIEVVRAWLTERLSQAQRGFGFLSGGVTFCAMLPMRSIPFRVIALLGMHDGAFPRRNPSPGFSLIARSPRQGDRSLRDEDRYLFLEALLSARERLHISYRGQSVRDNAELPPSVLVSELLDYVAAGFTTAAAGSLLQQVQVRHRLQPFSPDYFSGDQASPYFSYSPENCHGVTAKRSGAAPPVPFLTAPIPLAADEAQVVSLTELADFLGNPARHFLRRRLGVFLGRDEELLAESEPLILDPLERYQLDQEIVTALLAGTDPDAHLAVLRGRGTLPPGGCGTELYRSRLEAVQEFAIDVRQASAGEPLPPLDIDLELGEARLVGRLSGIRPGGLVRHRFATLKAKDRLRAWVDHLALNAAAPAGFPLATLLYGSDVTVAFAPVTTASALLARLISRYRQGMTAPLPFFPETSLEYAKKARDPKKSHKALDDARKKWHGSEERPGEKRDPSLQRLFGEVPPLEGEFTAVARDIYDPLLASGTEVKRA